MEVKCAYCGAVRDSDRIFCPACYYRDQLQDYTDEENLERETLEFDRSYKDGRP